MIPVFTEASDTTFGPAKVGDLEALVALDSGSPSHWSAAAFASELEQTPPTVFVARSSGHAVAFVVSRIQGAEMDIVNLAVSRMHRRRGLGFSLIRSLLSDPVSSRVETVFLEVREGNHPARALYRRLGFQEAQRRPGFYREPAEDAVLMRLEIGPKAG